MRSWFESRLPSHHFQPSHRLRSPRGRAGRRHPRRGAGHPDALRDAEAAAPAVRPADDRVAGRGCAGGGRARRWSSSRARSGARGRARRRGRRSRCSSEPLGTADAVKAAAGARSRGADTVIVLNGDHPLISAETIRRWPRPTSARARPRRWRPRCSTTRAATAGWSGRPTARSSASSRPRRRATPPSSSSTSARSAPASSRSRAARCCAALEEVGSDNAQGELYLPDVLPILRAARAHRASRTRSPTRARRSAINDRVGLAEVTRGRAAPDPRAPHARRGDDRRPGRDRDRRRRARSAQDTVIAPFTSLHGATEIGARQHDRPADAR